MSAEIRRLIEKWRDPEFWKDEGAAMDSTDCARELEALLPALPPDDPPRCSTCGHSHYFESDHGGFDTADTTPWGRCKTCHCSKPTYERALPAEPATPPAEETKGTDA